METNFPIVGLGASAGGVEALRRFFEHVAPDSGAAYVVILHLSPDHDSHLASVLQGAAAIPVTQVTERIRVQPDAVYVIPPSCSLSMVDGHLTLSDIGRIEERRAPIDVFFRTLADTHPERAVGVVLSGTGADGSMGIKRIKESGGVCIAQDPRDAQYGDMPRNSIETGVIDYVLPVADIPQKIRDLDGRLQQVEALRRPAHGASEEDALRELFTLLKLGTGHDFSNYKRATVMRRIARRMLVNEVTTLPGYVERVRTQPSELRALLKDLLISVTHFFRDAETFTFLAEEVVPKIFDGKGRDDQVRAWVPACATGEEAYSVAILLAEAAASMPAPPAILVFATDIDEHSVSIGRHGIYSAIDTADVSVERLATFFTREGDHYRVRPELRQLVLFSHHNVIKDPPFSHLDLVSCRNLLIYLNRTAQRRVLDVLHFALRPRRFLMLGTSESVDGASELFQPLDKDVHVFESIPQAARPGLPVPEGRLHPVPTRLLTEPSPGEVPVPSRLPASFHQHLLEQFGPPSMVVGDQYDILHLSKGAARYLQVAGGAPSVNALTLIRPELRSELRGALYQATQQRVPVETSHLTVTVDEQPITLVIVVKPVFVDGSVVHLVVFREVVRAEMPSADSPVLLVHDNLTRRLEEELADVRAQLRATRERYEVHIEEHKASLEEQQAMNEELRSSSEELETSREELQSLNEELHTVNQELKVKIDEQAHANDDMQNLVGATEIGTIFLDRQLRIKFFTPAVTHIFHVIPGDRGRPLSDINSRLDDGRVQSDVERVLATLERAEREVRTHDGRWLLMRVHPYRTSDDRIDGVVLSFVDVTERKLVEERIRASEERLRRAAEVDNVGIMFFAMDHTITHGNDAFLRMTGLSRAKVQSGAVRWEDLFDTDPGSTPPAAWMELDSVGKTAPFERASNRPDGSMSFALCAATQLTPEEAVEFAVDVSGVKEAEARLHRSEVRHRHIVESVTDYAIFTISLAGLVDEWNPGAQRMFGYTEQEIVGEELGVLFTPEDRAAGVHALELRLADEHGHSSDERWHVRKDGSLFYASGITTVLRDPAGRRLGFVKIARDLTERKQWEDRLQDAHDALGLRVAERTVELAAANNLLGVELADRRAAEEQIRRLIARMISVQEDERRRIARDLHDHIGQQLVGLRLKLDSLKQDDGITTVARAGIEDAQVLIEKIDRDLDRVTWELRPATLDDLGLVVALRNFVAEWGGTFGVAGEFHSKGLDGGRMDQDVETCIFRIVQEALNNVYKHAHATTVSVILERRGSQLVLIIEDDGRGFDPDATSSVGEAMGLIGMRERAALCGGTAEIESGVGRGTTIYVRLPAKPA